MKRASPTKPTVRTDQTLPQGEGAVLWAIAWLFPDAEPRVTMLGSAKLVLGRDDACDVAFDTEQVSRQHCEIKQVKRSHVLRDLESTNGTYLNGARISEQVLSRGDIVRLGDWLGVVVVLPEAGSTLECGEIAPGILGGPTLQRALRPALRAAASDLPIIVEGETGTGKERVAQALHQLSKRQGEFVALNCAALPESLAEAELFGYRKGAFTGAERASLGCVRAADHGTLLLDEVSDFPLSLQVKLLRVLEQREVLPLGESRPVPVDVRVIAASQKPLHEAVADGSFRADLFARLEGMSVQLPPLRERIEDVPALLRQFIRQFAGPTVPALDVRLVEQLCLYDWPFNVRELVQLVRRLIALHQDEPVISKASLPPRFATPRWKAGRPTPRLTPAEEPRRALQLTARDEADLASLTDALRANGGNVARAAAEIGVSRQRAYRLMEAGESVELDELRRSGPALKSS